MSERARGKSRIRTADQIRRQIADDVNGRLSDAEIGRLIDIKQRVEAERAAAEAERAAGHMHAPVVPPAADTTRAEALAAEAIPQPVGTVETRRPYDGAPPNIPWTNVTRWTPLIQTALAEFPAVRRWLGEDVYRLIWSIMLVESAGNHYVAGGQVLHSKDDGYGDGPAIGVMQLKRMWESLVPGADIFTPAGNIRIGVAFLARNLEQRQGDWAAVIRLDYHPGTDPHSGVTPETYVQALRALIAEVRRDTPAELPVPQPAPTDPMVIILGGAAFNDDYGWRSRAGIDYSNYATGHGTSAWDEHPGIDLAVPVGTKLYAPAAGTVGCVGGLGMPQPGRACGAYGDIGGGPGNITLKLDVPGLPPLWLTYGHCRTAAVKPGERVQAGQLIGTVGDSNGAHVHIECSVLDAAGRYLLLEPRAALAPYLGSGPAPLPVPAKPKIEDLRNDGIAAKYGLTPAERDRLLRKCIRGRNGQRPRLIALHIQQGTTPGSLDHHANAVSASATVYINRDGTVVLGIAEEDGPWTNGEVNAPDAQVRALMQRYGPDPNGYTLSIEAEGHPEQEMPEAQFAAIVWVVRDWMTRYELGPDRIVGHFQIDATGRAFCGRYKDRVIAAVTGSVPLPGSMAFAPLAKPPAWDGTDKTVNGVTFVACQRRYSAREADVPVLQYANPKARAVRGPLTRGEAFTGWYLVEGDDKQRWIVSSTGARIPAAGCSPVVTLAEAA